MHRKSPLLGPLIGLASETVGTGIRLVPTGALSIAHHRLGSSIGRRYVFEAADPQEYTAVGVPRALQDGVRGVARTVDVNRGRLMQFALAPTSAEASSTEVVRAIGQRLSERWQEHTHLLPVALEELPWPLPISHALASQPPSGVRQPVALSVDTELGAVSWLDAEEDGPTFVVTGPARSGRSTTLIAAATVMQRLGWQVAAVPLSRRSPLAEGGFPGEILAPEDIKTLTDAQAAVALFIDDAHKWSGDVDQFQEFVGGPGPRAVVVAGPTEFFAARSDLTRALPTRCALVLSPRTGMDASSFGVRRLPDDVLRDTRAGRGVLVVSGETIMAQVPFVA